MRIEHLKINNFRNYSNLEIDFHKNVNIFIGENGKGKTNILESIYVLSLTKTNRYGLEENLIKFNLPRWEKYNFINEYFLLVLLIMN